MKCITKTLERNYYFSQLFCLWSENDFCFIFFSIYLLSTIRIDISDETKELEEACLTLSPLQGEMAQVELNYFFKSILQVLSIMYGYIDTAHLTVGYNKLREPNSEIVILYCSLAAHNNTGHLGFNEFARGFNYWWCPCNWSKRWLFDCTTWIEEIIQNNNEKEFALLFFQMSWVCLPNKEAKETCENIPS